MTISKHPQARIVFAVGPGDTVSSHDEWVTGDSKGAATSLTYTAQTLDYCRDAEVTAWLISSCERVDVRRSAKLVVENRPKPQALSTSGLGFHLQQLAYAWSLFRSVRQFRATHAVVDSGTSHWFAWGLMSLLGVKVYVSFHNTYYTIGHWRPSFSKNLLRKLDSWFFKHGSDGALGVSEECITQYVELGGDPARGVIYNAIFEPEDFTDFQPKALGGEMRIAYVGRLEVDKGVIDLLDAFEQLREQQPELAIHLDYCGHGQTMATLAQRVESSPHLRGRVTLHGQLKRQALLAVYRQCHVVVVPTTSHFMEGFPKVCAEAVLARRPQIISTAVPTIEGLKDAALVYPCDRPEALAAAMRQLLTDAAMYARAAALTTQLSSRFHDPRRGLKHALAAIIR
jgi:glycogen(starch) synthase